MSETPEKIYHEVRLGTFGYDQEPEDTVYIRADIVDELVEALEKCWMAMNGGGTWTLEDQDKTKAALKKARG